MSTGAYGVSENAGPIPTEPHVDKNRPALVHDLNHPVLIPHLAHLAKAAKMNFEEHYAR
jgi:hypothetical protein